MAFTRFTKNVLNVSALPDRVQNQAQTLKATFDQAGVDIKTALNALIAELEASTSADNIGADVQSVATKTVQAILTAFEEAIADRYTKTEAETLLAIETNNLLADLDINLTTGVITTTKKDGTKVTFDTAIEKVPSKFEFVESGDTYLLKITNVDGTTTQADVTKLMNIYNFNNSDYITFEVTGEGTEKTVIANIKANSIGLDKLSLSVVSTLEGYANSARDSATAAKTSETNARASELNALEAKNTAVTKANEASASASAAKTSETNAEYWAKQAQAGGGGGGITEIPVATADTLGGIKVGGGLSITEDGVLSTEGGSGSSTAIETVLFEGEFETKDDFSEKGLLSDNIKNYDYVILTSYQVVPASGKKTRYVNALIDTRDVEIENVTLGSVYWCIGNFDPRTSNGYGYAITGNFGDGTQIQMSVIAQSGVSTRTHGICRVVGIKNCEMIEVDSTPTENSVNPISSGAVYEAIDNMPYKVLEASTDNVIDFNTLTETGVYLIKNVSDGAGTTLNSGLNTSTASIVYNDIKLEVRNNINVAGTSFVYQARQHSTGQASYYRYLTDGTWSDWTLLKFPASYVTAGTLATGMKCDTPTADTELANKAYVDTQVAKKADANHSQGASTITAGTLAGKVLAQASSVATLNNSQLRNIKAQTTDLTAGTSALTTGDIVLIYE